MRRTASTAPTYSHRAWLDKLQAAQVSERDDLAIEWLRAYITTLEATRLSRDAILQKDFPRDMRVLRSLAQYVPHNHRYFEQRDSGIEHIFNMGRSLTTCLLTEVTRDENYFNYPITITTTSEKKIPWATESLALTRDLWLARDPAVRRAALLDLASDSDRFAQQNHYSSAPELMCEAAWEVAGEAGMDAVSVTAATRLTLWSARTYAPDVDRGDSIRRAINALFRRCLLGSGAHPGVMPVAEIKDTLVTNPAACASTLLFITKTTHLATEYIHPGAVTTQDVFDSLYTWLPKQRSVLELSNSMGLSPVASLEQTVSNLLHSASDVELAFEVGASTNM